MVVLQKKTRGKQALICLDSLLVVDGALGKAQKWKRHGWLASKGPVGHVDLWDRIVSKLEVIGHEVHWLQLPSHTGIKRNHRAHQLADVGRRLSPVLFGLISICMNRRVVEDEEEGEDQALLGLEDEAPEELMEQPVQMTKAKIQSATTSGGTELVCAAVQRGKH